MKKVLTLLLALCFVAGCAGVALADDDDYDDDDCRRCHHRYSSYHRYDDDDDDDCDDCRRYRYKYDDDDDYRYWRDHGNYDRWRDRRYKIWYHKCQKYGGSACTYSSWNRNENWSDYQWDNYWKTHRPRDYENVQKFHRKMNALNQAIDATRSIFIW